MKRSVLISLAVLLVLIPATLFLGTRLTGRMYYLTSTLVVLETMLPFFLRFETRKPKARELVILAVMCALATVSRLVVLLPNFKPITGIIMITGMAFGPEAGFLTGAVSAFASNFFFSQGPWTPWQMMAYGTGGFLAGLVFYRIQDPAGTWKKLAGLAAFGFLAVLLVVGPLLDCCTLFTTGTAITWKFALAVFTVGLPHNFQHALATAATLLLFGKPLLWKLNRLRVKYGMLESDP